MHRLLPLALTACAVAFAQSPDAARNSELLLARVEAAPPLDVEVERIDFQPPRPGWAVEMVSSVAAGPGGVLYALQRGPDADPVLVVDGEGRLLRSWGAGLFEIPHSIRVAPDGSVWTVDSGSSTIYQFSPAGEILLRIDVGEMPEKESRFRGAADIAFAPDGNLIVADGYGNARILEYTPDGRRVREWGKPGSGPGEFHLPHAVAVDERGVVYVGDRENGRIQRFDREGRYLDHWDGLGKAYALVLDGDALWLACHRLDQPNGSPGWLLRLDRDSGEVLGAADSTGTHAVSVAANGAVFVPNQPDHILRFR